MLLVAGVSIAIPGREEQTQMGIADHMPAFSQPERYSRSTIVQSEGHTTFSTRYKLPDLEFHLISRRMCRHVNQELVVKKQLWQSEATKIVPVVTL